MKTTCSKILALVAIVSISSSLAQSKYSGIYDIKVGTRVLVAVTKGGHLLSVGKNSDGIAHELDPSRSTVDSTGKVIGRTPDGVTFSGRISSDYQFTGTAKDHGKTIRITGGRVLN